jgi:hypothetical protein
VVALLGVADVQFLGLSLDAVLSAPGRPWEQSVSLSIFARIRRAFRRCFGIVPPPERRIPLRNAHLGAPPKHRPISRSTHLDPPPESRVWGRAPPLAPPRRTEAVPRPRSPTAPEAGQALLEETRVQISEEQRRRTANRVAQLFTEGLARKRALKDAKLKEEADRLQSSSAAPARSSSVTWPRKRPKFYAVRKGRNVGVYNTWEECEMQVRGVANEYKSFGSFEEAKAYVLGRRLNFMLHRRPSKPRSSFVGGKALRAELEVWQDGFVDSLRVECALDAMSDVNLARVELLHDVHEVVGDKVKSSAGKSSTLKVLCISRGGLGSARAGCDQRTASAFLRCSARHARSRRPWR